MAHWRKPTVLSLCIAIGALPIVAPAQTGLGSIARKAEMQLHQKFLHADQDKDGFVTKDEAKAGNMPTTAEHFDEIDSTHRGKVSEKEIQHFLLQKAGERAAKPPGAT